jgi:DNA polymerase III subunit epsilon
MSVLGEPLVFVDIETNGLNHIRGRVIEVAAIRIEEGRVVREFNQLIDPGAPLPQFITNLTGITETDLQGAPLFVAVADELLEVMQGAIFVAHNVRFDYSFLKQEFRRIGKQFSPRQLCTVRLSRALYPTQRSHKLQSLIDRHGFAADHRHRAYDDAYVLWQFLQHVYKEFGPTTLEQAITKQLKKPSLPKGLSPEMLTNLPEATGVYIFEDETGAPIYVGKSVNIKKRVASHFVRDTENVGEFKIAQSVRNIRYHETKGELDALLLESQLVKELLPLHNKLLRRVEGVIIAKKVPNEHGYMTVHLEESSPSDITSHQNILAVYSRRSHARNALDAMQRDYTLCPKLLGLEKAKGACFLHQLKRCNGACAQKEPATVYNARVSDAFYRQQIASWPFEGPVLMQDKNYQGAGLIVDKWCVLGRIQQEEDCEPVVSPLPRAFDLDAYNILRSYLAAKAQTLSIKPLSNAQLQGLGI